ncbi:MAG: T9SS type A sorting domain-containing protein [Bacteroidota bacterium]
MKKFLLSFSALTLLATSVNAQCTPVDCSASLPPFGGVCDSLLIDGTINQAYSDFESFVLTANCFDAGEIDPGSAGTSIKITKVYNFSFADFPAGLTGVTSASQYLSSASGPTLGCASMTGTPTEMGKFHGIINLVADVELCGAFPIPQTGNPAEYDIYVEIKPNASFSGLSASGYCATDNSPVTLAITGTTGGVFSGPGVVGNTFTPSAAGAGTHDILYIVSGMQGAAYAPSVDTAIVSVEVFNTGSTFYEDADSDGYGYPGTTLTGCTVPAGYVSNNLDCDDGEPLINPDALDLTVDGIDQDCSATDGNDAGIGINELANNSMNVYPNPTSGLVTVDMSQLTVINSIEVVDLNGRSVINNKTVNAGSAQVDMSSLENGFYIIRVNTLMGTAVKRVSVQH